MRLQCPTCLELFTPEDDLQCPPCGHVFHRHCIHEWFILYTARSQHAEIENSHSQRGKSEQALLKSYCKVLALPAHEFRVEVRVFN